MTAILAIPLAVILLAYLLRIWSDSTFQAGIDTGRACAARELEASTRADWDATFTRFRDHFTPLDTASTSPWSDN